MQSFLNVTAWFYLAKYSASIDICGHLTFKKVITEEKKKHKQTFVLLSFRLTC